MKWKFAICGNSKAVVIPDVILKNIGITKDNFRFYSFELNYDEQNKVINLKNFKLEKTVQNNKKSLDDFK